MRAAIPGSPLLFTGGTILSKPKNMKKTGFLPYFKACSPKKKLILILASVFLLLTLWIIGSVIYEVSVNGEYYAFRYAGTEQRCEPLAIKFAPADCEADISENEGYVAKNRFIRYITGSQSSDIAITEDGAFYGPEFVFLQNYLRCLISGDYGSYPSFFTEDYAENESHLPIPAEPFTAQMLYDITVDYRAGDTVYVSQNEKKQYFIVKYAIYQNNGTFRPDLQTDTVMPLLFEITTVGEEMKISKIIKYSG